MTKNIVVTTLMAAVVLASCRPTIRKEVKNEVSTLPETIKETDLLIGSWVEPNPINTNEVQGIQLNEDGTAQSINMATLVYKSWWRENGKLVLVVESIGNGVTSIDTIQFQILKLNEKELEIKDNDYTVSYKRQ